MLQNSNKKKKRNQNLKKSDVNEISKNNSENRPHRKEKPFVTEDSKKSDDEHKQELQKLAERRVRLGLLMSEVGRINNIEIAQEDLNKRLMEEARRHPGHEQEVFESYKKNPEAMEQLSAPIYEDKVVDFIIEQAKVTDIKSTMEDLIKAIDEENNEQKERDKSKKTVKKEHTNHTNRNQKYKKEKGHITQ